MILYHGSNVDIQNISLSACRPYKDFDTLLKGMIYKKTSSQYSFHTPAAISLLRKISHE